jgi:crotonobetainyl-CoA:carnitine CoA-transferase CaiB-like acyl-CoA transferase
MSQPLAGVRILEVASHVFVPIAGGVLHEWGAEVIKVEHPETGPARRWGANVEKKVTMVTPRHLFPT